MVNWEKAKSQECYISECDRKSYTVHLLNGGYVDLCRLHWRLREQEINDHNIKAYDKKWGKKSKVVKEEQLKKLRWWKKQKRLDEWEV